MESSPWTGLQAKNRQWKKKPQILPISIGTLFLGGLVHIVFHIWRSVFRLWEFSTQGRKQLSLREQHGGRKSQQPELFDRAMKPTVRVASATLSADTCLWWCETSRCVKSLDSDFRRHTNTQSINQGGDNKHRGSRTKHPRSRTRNDADRAEHATHEQMAPSSKRLRRKADLFRRPRTKPTWLQTPPEKGLTQR